MGNDEVRRTPFDQRAALEELERFGRDIERYRAQREALGDEFETFVQSFKAPPESALVRETTRPPAAPATPRPSAPAAEPAGFVAEAGVPVAAAAPAAVAVEPARPPVARAPSTFPTPAVLGAALVVILATGLLARTFWNRGAEPAAPVSGTADAPVPAPASQPASSPTPAPPSPGVSGAPASESEVATVRRVWMRVIVDGEKVLEREVPAGTRVPLKAEKTIVIRTGDAGAVRLRVRGQERGFLGAEGEVVTRSFSVPPRQPPPGR